MEYAPVSKNDEQRVRSLHDLNVLDTPPEERFDRLTRLARHLFDVPIALVSLVDADRQWFKSSQGLEATELPRASSFCGHAIYDSQPFIVEDASRDPRFHGNPLVLGAPYVRFYAGCPLRNQDGQPMGTLCIIDRVPREVTPEDIDALKDLATMAERELIALQLATIDELTGISNRRGFTLLAQKSLNYSARYERPAALIFLDLNKFKAINDQYGHAEGDKVLIAFADIVKQCFRESDIFGRIGGDEFAVLLSDTDKPGADAAVDKFHEALASYNASARNPYDIRVSAGVVEYNRFRHTSLDLLMADGDRLMYWQKEETALGRLNDRGTRS